MNYVVAAKYIKKSVSFVKKWVQRFKESKTVDDLPNRGSVGKVTKKDEKRIVALFGFWRFARVHREPQCSQDG